MTTETITMNSYNVTFTFDYTTIRTRVIAKNEYDCEDLAANLIYADLGFSNLSSFLKSWQEIEIELFEENVL
jgi:hypothetical protein